MIIGLVTNITEEDKISCNANYLRWLKTLGTVIMIDPFQEELEKIDLLVLPGGSDVNPLRYMGYWPKECGLPQRSLEFFDGVVLPGYIENNTRILGICRGMQSLNVVLGGTLNPDVSEPTSTFDGSFAHFVKYQNGYYPCSSNHHQCIDVLSDKLTTIMTGYDRVNSSKKTLPDVNNPLCIEGYIGTYLPILGLQFHPEKNHDNDECLDINKEVVKLIHQL